MLFPYRCSLIHPVPALAIIAACFAAGASPVLAQTFDANAQFSATTNPNSVWSYGYTNTIGSSLILFNIAPGDGAGLRIWLSSNVSTSNTPSFLKNLGPTTQFGIGPGQISLHPGPQNQYAVLRFTAPTAGSYSINSQFFIGDTGDTDANILVNSNTGTPQFFAATTNTNPTYSGIVNLGLNGTIDFVVGSKGNFLSDSTPLTAVVTTVSTAAPEPATVTLLLPIMCIAGIVMRRHRNGEKNRN